MRSMVTSEKKISPMLRVLPSLTDLIFLAPFAIVLFLGRGASSLLEGDTGWHIRTGEWILRNGRVPDKDIFSYTKAGEPWFAWEWLWDVGAALLHQHGGLAPVILVNLLMISVTMALVFRMARTKARNSLIAFGVTGVAMGASVLHWLSRPHLMGWLLLLICYGIVDGVYNGADRKRLWLLLPLTILWTNTHGSFFLGIVMLGIYATGELLSGILSTETSCLKSAIRRARWYVLAGVGCFVASFVNPYGYHLHAHVVRFLFDPYFLNSIIEYLPTAFRGGLERYLEPLLLLSAICAVWNARRGRLVYTVLLLAWAHLALTVVRNVPIFALLATPLVAEMLAVGLSALASCSVPNWLKTVAREFKDISDEIEVMDRPWRTHVVGGVLIAVIAIVMYAPAQPKALQASYDSEYYPESALNTLRRLPSQARIFTDDEWGDFLIYRLYPLKKVFVDGRADMYGSKFGQAYLDVMGVTYDWEKKLAVYGVDTVLLPTKRALATTLKESRHWRVLFDDGTSIIFVQLPKANSDTDQVSAASPQYGEKRDVRIAQEQYPGGTPPVRHN